MPAAKPIQKTDVLPDILTWGSKLAALPGRPDVEDCIGQTLATLFGLHDYLVIVASEQPVVYDVLLAHPQSVYHKVSPAVFAIADGAFIKRLKYNEPVLESLEYTGLSHHAVAQWKQAGVTEVLGIALGADVATAGVVWFPMKRAAVIGSLNTSLFKAVCAQLSLVVALMVGRATIARQREALSDYKDQLDNIHAYLQGETDVQRAAGDIIGTGAEMQKVFQRISQVSFASSTVLILGETGTGKELVARAIHNGSPRKDKLLVKVNCAALPASLIESELFGHERGSFTGATERRIGKFELADKGTLFLDEIGELPPELQVKLLRALQEKEIERVGGKATIRVDVRIIAATNRQLEKEVNEGRFRKDLYYRLNVFPITLPPLRSRTEDIPALVSHFINKFSRNTGKKITNTSHKALNTLQAYHWPGNIRELEHFIERSVLMATGNTLKDITIPQTGRTEGESMFHPAGRLKNFADNERDHILRALKTCKGKVYGAGGAADLLGLKVSTLNSKILKLGIRKEKLFRRKADGG